MTYRVTRKADRFRIDGGAVITPDILLKGRTTLGLMMLDETIQNRIPKDDMDYLVGLGYLEEAD